MGGDDGGEWRLALEIPRGASEWEGRREGVGMMGVSGGLRLRFLAGHRNGKGGGWGGGGCL